MLSPQELSDRFDIQASAMHNDLRSKGMVVMIQNDRYRCNVLEGISQDFDALCDMFAVLSSQGEMAGADCAAH